MDSYPFAFVLLLRRQLRFLRRCGLFGLLLILSLGGALLRFGLGSRFGLAALSRLCRLRSGTGAVGSLWRRVHGEFDLWLLYGTRALGGLEGHTQGKEVSNAQSKELGMMKWKPSVPYGMTEIKVGGGGMN